MFIIRTTVLVTDNKCHSRLCCRPSSRRQQYSIIIGLIVIMHWTPTESLKKIVIIIIIIIIIIMKDFAQIGPSSVLADFVKVEKTDIILLGVGAPVINSKAQTKPSPTRWNSSAGPSTVCHYSTCMTHWWYWRTAWQCRGCYILSGPLTAAKTLCSSLALWWHAANGSICNPQRRP